MGLAIRKVLGRRTNGAKSCGSHSRNGDTNSDGGSCACCRDGFPVVEIVNCACRLLRSTVFVFLGTSASWEMKGAWPAGKWQFRGTGSW